MDALARNGHTPIEPNIPVLVSVEVPGFSLFSINQKAKIYKRIRIIKLRIYLYHPLV